MNTKTTKGKEGLRDKILKEIDFLSDHWVKGDDRPPFSFGGWREEVADSLMDIISQAIAAQREETLGEVDKLMSTNPLDSSELVIDRKSWELLRNSDTKKGQELINDVKNEPSVKEWRQENE